MKRLLLIEVNCGDLSCDDCVQMTEVEGMSYCGPFACQVLYCKEDERIWRLPECIEAEQKAKSRDFTDALNEQSLRDYANGAPCVLVMVKP